MQKAQFQDKVLTLRMEKLAFDREREADKAGLAAQQAAIVLQEQTLLTQFATQRLQAEMRQQQYEQQLILQEQKGEDVWQAQSCFRQRSPPEHMMAISTLVQPPTFESAPPSTCLLSPDIHDVLPANSDALGKLTSLLLQHVLARSSIASKAAVSPIRQTALSASSSLLSARNDRRFVISPHQASVKQQMVNRDALVKPSRSRRIHRPCVPLDVQCNFDTSSRSFKASSVPPRSAVAQQTGGAGRRRMPKMTTSEEEAKVESACSLAKVRMCILAQPRRTKSTSADNHIEQLNVVKAKQNRALYQLKRGENEAVLCLSRRSSKQRRQMS